jgi:hypothetical protein
MTLNWPGKLYTNIRGTSAIRPAEAAQGADDTHRPAGDLRCSPTGTTPRCSYRDLAAAARNVPPRWPGSMPNSGAADSSRSEKDGRRVVRRKTELLGLWVGGGYAERLRPKLVLGRYRSAEPKLADARCLHHARAQESDVMVTGGFAADKLLRALSRRQADVVHRRLETRSGRGIAMAAIGR